ncbi:hypothetical protein ABTC92_18760, partial [Acinetobacter baumannii]
HAFEMHFVFVMHSILHLVIADFFDNGAVFGQCFTSDEWRHDFYTTLFSERCDVIAVHHP